MVQKRLLLFDIDGTILTAARNAFLPPFSEAIRDVLGFEADVMNYRIGGTTDPQMIHGLLAAFGLSRGEIEKAIPAIRNRYQARLSLCVFSREDVTLKPGVLSLLENLLNREDVSLGLLTGNFEVGARAKLETHGLNRYFPFGAFGDDAPDRSHLPIRAVEAARRHTGILFQGKDIVIIGDTPHDVSCGRPLGVKTVAVATGLYTAETLEKESPDFLFESLADTGSVLEAIFSDGT